jgi:hypothetical protein
MKRMRRLAQSVLMAALIAVVMVVGTARLDAADKKGGGDPHTAICAYYWSIITYPYVGPTIQAYVLSLYIAEGCIQ